jgi:hypothetical protein
MPSTYREIEAILTLLQFVSLIGLSVGRLRMGHWLSPHPRKEPLARAVVWNSLQVQNKKT